MRALPSSCSRLSAYASLLHFSSRLPSEYNNINADEQRTAPATSAAVGVARAAERSLRTVTPDSTNSPSDSSTSTTIIPACFSVSIIDVALQWTELLQRSFDASELGLPSVADVSNLARARWNQAHLLSHFQGDCLGGFESCWPVAWCFRKSR